MLLGFNSLFDNGFYFELVPRDNEKASFLIIDALRHQESDAIVTGSAVDKSRERGMSVAATMVLL